MAGVVLDQIQLPLAHLQDCVVSDLAPLVVVGPALHLLGDRRSEVVHGTPEILVVVQPDLLSHGAALHHMARTVGDGTDIDAEPLIAVDIAVIQAVDLMLHQGLEGLGVVVHASQRC